MPEATYPSETEKINYCEKTLLLQVAKLICYLHCYFIMFIDHQKYPYTLLISSMMKITIDLWHKSLTFYLFPYNIKI